MNGFFDDTINSDCQICNIKCTLCENNWIHCTQCNTTLRNTDAPNCTCIDNYYETEENDCFICDV